MTTEPLFNLKFNLLSLSETTKVYPSKFAAMEEKVCTLCSLDETKSTVCDEPFDYALSHQMPPLLPYLKPPGGTMPFVGL